MVLHKTYARLIIGRYSGIKRIIKFVAGSGVRPENRQLRPESCRDLRRVLSALLHREDPEDASKDRPWGTTRWSEAPEKFKLFGVATVINNVSGCYSCAPARPEPVQCSRGSSAERRSRHSRHQLQRLEQRQEQYDFRTYGGAGATFHFKCLIIYSGSIWRSEVSDQKSTKQCFVTTHRLSILISILITYYVWHINTHWKGIWPYEKAVLVQFLLP